MTTLAQKRSPFLRIRQPSLSYLPVADGQALGHAGDAILLGIKARVVVAQDLLAPIALDALGTRIPARHHPRRIEHVDGIVRDAMNQQAEMLLGLMGDPVGTHTLRRLENDGEHARGPPVLTQDRGVVQGQRDLLRNTLAMKHQLLVGEGKRAPGQPLRHDMTVEIGDLRPALQHLGAEQPRVAAAGKERIGIVVDHDPVGAPEEDHRHGRAGAGYR